MQYKNEQSKNLSDEGILSSCVVLTGGQTSPKQAIDTN